MKDGVKAFTVRGRRVIFVMVSLLVMILIFMKSFSLVLERDIPTGIARGVVELSKREFELTNLRGSLFVRLLVIRRSCLTKLEMNVSMS